MKDLFKVNDIVKINWDEFAKDFGTTTKQL